MNPLDPKFRKINMENKAFQNKVKNCFNGPEIMVHMGYK